MSRQYYVIDAFTSQRYAGNAAAIVLDAEGLSDREMQLVAAEFNLSETTFVLPPQSHDASVRFRWFTPTTEVAMCGHATIGGVQALVESGRLRCEGVEGSTPIQIDTLSGTLAAFVETLPAGASLTGDDADAGGETQRMIWLDMPTPVLSELGVPGAELASVLNVPSDDFDSSLPPARTQDHDALVFVKDVLTLNDAKPDFAKLMNLQMRKGLRGLCLATTKTLTPSIHVQSRFFAPAAGIDEDPVTGSVHGPLAAYLITRGLVPSEDGTSGMRCVQGKAGGRAGLVFALGKIESDGSCSVRIGGQAVTAMQGTLVE